MTITEALAIAADRVSIVPQGNQYVLHTWSPKHNATWVSHAMTRPAALEAAWEAKVRTALDVLGVEDAGAEAFAARDSVGPVRGDWRAAVRRIWKARHD